jgi:hypothetical protein
MGQCLPLPAAAAGFAAAGGLRRPR